MAGWKVPRILALRREGLTYEVIAERLGLHRNSVYRVALSAGLVVKVYCVACGRRTWRCAPGGLVADSRPVVCPDCKPKRKLVFKRGGGSSGSCWE